jgi:hypothetical protein
MKAKLVKESLIKEKNLEINEELKIKGHTLKVIKLGNDKVYAGKDGLLAKNDVVIPWHILEKIKKSI